MYWVRVLRLTFPSFPTHLETENQDLLLRIKEGKFGGTEWEIEFLDCKGNNNRSSLQFDDRRIVVVSNPFTHSLVFSLLLLLYLSISFPSLLLTDEEESQGWSTLRTTGRSRHEETWKKVFQQTSCRERKRRRVRGILLDARVRT